MVDPYPIGLEQTMHQLEIFDHILGRVQKKTGHDNIPLASLLIAPVYLEIRRLLRPNKALSAYLEKVAGGHGHFALCQ